MARKHEHFGFRYLEELNLVKERENISKKCRQEFLKFKQTATVHTELYKSLLEVPPPEWSPEVQLLSRGSSRSPALLLEDTELAASKIKEKIGVISVNETGGVTTQQKKSPKKDDTADKKQFGKRVFDYRSSGVEEIEEKVPVAIASLVGTTKKIAMLKKPEPPPKFKCKKVCRAKSPPKSSIPLHKVCFEIEEPEQRVRSETTVPTLSERSTLVIEIRDSHSVVSSSSSMMQKEISKPQLLSPLMDTEKSLSKKSSRSSSVRSLEETRAGSRSDTSKAQMRLFVRSRAQIHGSFKHSTSGVVPRSIDEIIASLKSTTPTPSDLRIKELLESILGHDYSVKIQPSLIIKEPQPTVSEPSAENVVPTDDEQIKLSSQELSEGLKMESSFQAVTQDVLEAEADAAKDEAICIPVIMRDDEKASPSADNVIEEEPLAKVQEVPEESKEKLVDIIIPSQEILDIQESAESAESYVEAEHLQKSTSHKATRQKKITPKAEPPPVDVELEIQGKAFTKAKAAEIQKHFEDLPEQQAVSVLSTWTTKIKDVDYPLIHVLCAACPKSVLPVDLQLVSRVHHTIDKKGHNVLLPRFNLECNKLEDLFPATAALEKQMASERICNKGLPISEVYQCSQEDGIKVLPPKSPESMPEWQRVAEFYVEKPQLELLGEKVKFHQPSLKMFWMPAAQKFSAPLSVMKKILFPKYESNMINGVICEDFSCDLRDEEVESEADFDFSNTKVSSRCHSCPGRLDAEMEILQENLTKRSHSAPELFCHKEKTGLQISADFKTTMEEINVMKKYDPSTQKPEFSSEKVKKMSRNPTVQKSATKKEKDPVENTAKARRSISPSKTASAQDVPLSASALAEESRKAGIKYIVFPKATRGKASRSGKHLSRRIIESICDKLNEPSRTLKRTTSVENLHTHKKYSIKVSQAVRRYRCPSLPVCLDFKTFSEKNGRSPEDSDDYCWAQKLWSKWFDEAFPPSKPTLQAVPVSSPNEKEKETPELADLENPLLLKSKRDHVFQSEIDEATQQINDGHASAFNYCRRGAIYRKIGRMKAAMDDLEMAISLEPSLIDAYWHRHLIFLYQNKIIPALEDLNFILKYNKTHADAYLSRADIYRKQGDNSLAIINYSLAAKCRPTDDEIYYKRGEMYEEDGDLLMAMEDYTKCLYYNPRRTDALMKHGIHYFNKSAWAVAINDFTTLIEEDSSNAEARTFRGRAYIKLEQFRNAAEDFSIAIHLDPSNWTAYYYRGCILRKIDQKQALQDLSVSVLLNHTFDNVSAFLHRGILYAELKQWTLAICDFENVIILDRTITSAYINIGLIMMLYLDRYFDSIQQFTSAIQIDPLEIRPYLCRAQAYHKIHDLKSAVKDINRAIHMYPNSPHLYLTRGQCLLAMKNYKLASFCIHQVAEMGQGTLERSLVQEALVQSFCQNHHKAIECALAAAKKQPDADMFALLGKIQMKARKHKDAVSSFQQALKILTGSAKGPPNTIEAAELYFLMGRCYMEQVALIEACDAFTSAVKLYPQYADAFYQRGLCRMQLQQSKCILDFNKTLAILPTHFQAYLSRAAYFGSKGRYSKGIMNCTEALKIHPRSVRAYLYRGALKFHNRTYIYAVEDLTSAIDLDNVCYLAYYNRALSYHRMKDYKNALKDYGIVLLLEAKKDVALKVLINRALLYVELNQYDHALEDFEEVALDKPKDSQLFKAIGLCYHRLQEYEEAVRSFSKVLRIDPFSLDGYIGRGNSYLEYDDMEGTNQALKDFVRAIHLNPVCIKARLCLGYNLQALGKFQRAWNQFTAAIQIDPNCHIAYDGRAVVCLQMGDTFAAFQDTNAALKITTNAELLTNRGVINQFMGYLNCAMKDYQQAITIDPNYALAYFNAANIYFMNRQFSQANEYYSKALALDPKNESAFLNRAITNTLLKNFEEAKADFEKAICLSPFSAAIYFNKANLYSTLQQYEQADEDVSKALSIQPYDALMYKLRADIRGKMGLIKEAIADYKKAISIQALISSG